MQANRINFLPLLILVIDIYYGFPSNKFAATATNSTSTSQAQFVEYLNFLDSTREACFSKIEFVVVAANLFDGECIYSTESVAPKV